jgi:putative CocE/NonD family hydrolase
LHSQGKANTLSGDGVLSREMPGAQVPDRYTYDPTNPVPTAGGNNLFGVPIGPYDQRKVEERSDVLVYSSPVLEKAVEVTGPIKLFLYASSNATDTDFTAKLVDVHPMGYAQNLVDGIIRARYRASKKTPSLIDPEQVYAYEIDLGVTSNVFHAGHRIRVEISSSNFPRFDRNPNTGHVFGVDDKVMTAEQAIYHDAEHASYIFLPIIE